MAWFQGTSLRLILTNSLVSGVENGVCCGNFKERQYRYDKFRVTEVSTKSSGYILTQESWLRLNILYTLLRLKVLFKWILIFKIQCFLDFFGTLNATLSVKRTINMTVCYVLNFIHVQICTTISLMSECLLLFSFRTENNKIWRTSFAIG